jgi:hypothetical protein
MNTICKSKRYSPFAAFFLYLFASLSVYIIIETKPVHSQNKLAVIGFGHDGSCSGSFDSICCIELKVEISRTGTRWFRIELTGSPGVSSPDCLNMDCLHASWEVNGIPQAVGNTLHSTFDMQVRPSKLIIEMDTLEDGWTDGTEIVLKLCHNPILETMSIDCYKTWNVTDFWTFNTQYPSATDPLDAHNIDSNSSTWCGYPAPLCPDGCDIIDTMSNPQMWTFCVKRQGGDVDGTEIRVTIKPPIDFNNNCYGSSFQWTGKCHWKVHPGDSLWYKDNYGVWSKVAYTGAVDSCINRFDTTTIQTGTETIIHFTPRPEVVNLPPCGTFCIKIRKCPPTQLRKVKMETLPPHELTEEEDSCGTDTVSAAFKVADYPSAHETQTGSPNYPNPFGTDNKPKTTIPFSISEKGMAILKLYSAQGDKMYIDEQMFESPGNNSFILNARDLPPGAYLYTIESPEGNLIVNRKLLIVK